MPKRTLTVLTSITITLLIAYVALISAAIFFATMRTEMSAALRSAETRVGALETTYYQEIAKLNATDVVSIGYVTPSEVGYVALDGSPTVTRADR